MSQVLQYGVDAVSLGGIYALMTLGLGLLFSVMRLINFAYGELLMAGGFAIVYSRDLPWPLMVAATVIVVVIVALLMERVAFRPLRGADPMTLLLASFAVSVMLQNGAQMIFGPYAKGVRPYDFLDHQYTVGGVRIAGLDIVTAVVTLGLVVALVVVLQKTRRGVELRAAAEDFEMAAVLGVRSNRVIAWAFAMAGVLAAAAALILILQLGAVTVAVGFTPTLIAFVGIVIGGMGSLPGAALGGFVLGATTGVLGAALSPELAPFQNAFLFGLVIVMLAVRPGGLIPEKVGRV